MISTLSTPRKKLMARYERKLTKNLGLQAEIERVLNKFPEARLEAIIQRAIQNPQALLLINPEVLKLAARLEKRLIRLNIQSKNFEAILSVLQKPSLPEPTAPAPLRNIFRYNSQDLQASGEQNSEASKVNDVPLVQRPHPCCRANPSRKTSESNCSSSL